MSARRDQVATLIDTGELDVHAFAAPMSSSPSINIDVYEADEDDDSDDARTELTEVPSELVSQTKLRTLSATAATPRALTDPPPHYVPPPPPMRAPYSSCTDVHPLPAPLPISVARELTRRVRARTGRTPAFTPVCDPDQVATAATAWLPDPPPPASPAAVVVTTSHGQESSRRISR